MLHITPSTSSVRQADAGDAARTPQPPQGEWDFTDLEMRDVVNADALDLIEATVAAGATPPVPRSGGSASFPVKRTRRAWPLEELAVTPPTWPMSER